VWPPHVERLATLVSSGKMCSKAELKQVFYK
jgi:hypothetical protein